VGDASDEEEIRSGEGFSNGSGRWLKNLLGRAGQKWENISTLNVIGCQPPENIFPGDKKWKWTTREIALEGVEYCRTHHLEPGLALAGKPRLYAIGAKALNTLTGKTGISTWRGSPLPLKTELDRGVLRTRVMPVLHPRDLMRQPKMTGPTVADLKKSLILPPESYNLFPSLQDVRSWTSTEFSFDFEWNGRGEITLCGLSDRFFQALVVPFIPPYTDELRRIFESARVLIGHNIIGADLAWIEKLGWKLRDDLRIEDTMIKQHLVQPDLPHGLDFVASVFTGMVFWKGRGWEEMDEEHEGDETPGQQWRTWDRPDALPRELGGYGGCLTAQEAFALYNARDTDAEFQINTPLDAMLRKWDLRSTYWNVSRPAAYICRWIGERGLRVDTGRLAGLREVIDGKIGEYEAKLPEGLAPFWKTVPANLPAPEGTYRPKSKTCKGTKKNPHDPVTFIFEHPEVTQCTKCSKYVESGKMSLAKILKGTRQIRVVPYNSPPRVAAYVKSCNLKEIIDRKTGNRTTGSRARGQWAKKHPEFTLLGALKEQITLRNNFAKDSLLGLDRMFFNLKVHGTSEGRLSSSGRRRGVDLNIQNQPEEFRVIYVPEREGWGFLNLDISQGENWLTAWIAQDQERLERLQDPSYDEHGELASRIFNTPVSSVLAKSDPAINALRQIGKKINHGRNYGMGVRKQLEELLAQGYDTYTEADIKEFIEIWKNLNKRTAEWQRETILLAERQGYLRNAFGRVRWFTSHSLATESLAFLPASTLADCVLRMMIAHYPEQFQTELESEKVGVYHSIQEEWLMSIQVHDSIVLQGPWGTHQEQLERSKQIMTQPWSQLGGFAFRVDVKGGTESWGDVKKL